MNILLTSNKGFLGHSLTKLFRINNALDYKIFTFEKTELNILDANLVKKYIDQYNIDIIIHNAIKGGRRIAEDDHRVFYENILMSENIMRISKYVKIIINFDSAASFDRRYDIYKFKESDLELYTPIDFYGLSKNISALRCRSYKNIYNLRIFNCFGEFETPERMITNNINNYINHKPMIIHQNKYMDFFYIDDLYNVLLYIIRNTPIDKDINLCYNEKTTLQDVCEKINRLSDYIVPIYNENPILSNGYCGNSDILYSYHIPLIGFDNALKIMYSRILKKGDYNVS